MPIFVLPGRLNDVGPRVLGLAVDLADRQIEAREELEHVGRDRRGAGDQRARAVEAERGLELADARACSRAGTAARAGAASARRDRDAR